VNIKIIFFNLPRFSTFVRNIAKVSIGQLLKWISSSGANPATFEFPATTLAYVVVG
jgi:hypothetical protein